MYRFSIFSFPKIIRYALRDNLNFQDFILIYDQSCSDSKNVKVYGLTEKSTSKINSQLNLLKISEQKF